jgi:hypothetical protein
MSSYFFRFEIMFRFSHNATVPTQCILDNKYVAVLRPRYNKKARRHKAEFKTDCVSAYLYFRYVPYESQGRGGLTDCVFVYPL